MSEVRSALPTVLSMTVVIVACLLLMRMEDASSSARVAEALGFTRGPIVDRRGRPLDFSVEGPVPPGRKYSLPGLTNVTGYVDSKRDWHGLEALYNSQLSGQTSRDDWRTFFLHLRGQAARGDSLQLTLDRTIQDAASRALGRNQGAVVAIDPRTGSVLAMVTNPTCQPNGLGNRISVADCEKTPGQPLLNRATQLGVPPGSAFKIVTLTAALDTKRFQLSSIFQGADIFGPSPYFDNSKYPSNLTRGDLTQLTLAQALAFSDNFTFAHIGLTLGAQTFLRYAHRYRIGTNIPFDYPVARSSVADGKRHPTAAQLARSSFGAEDDRMTPLQMGLIAATVANGGVMMAPHLVRAMRSATGRVLWTYHVRPLSTVMSPATARDVTKAMAFVVNHGSGYRAQIPRVQVAGKTGTAASGRSRPNAWFIAFAPASHPTIAVAVLHEFSGEGFEYAAPIARRILLAALREARTRRDHASAPTNGRS